MTLPTIAQPPAPTALAEMEARKDAAYLERNQVVAALAKAYPSGVARTAIEGWSEDWHGCVYIDLPTGQASWHFHDSQAYLFAGLPAYAGKWDGHDTPEKYRRLAALQPVQQPGAEPDMRHPKIQALIGSKARCQIELMLVEQLIEDPDCDLTSMDMEYWGPMHDRLKEALTKAAPAQRQPLSDDTKTQMWRAAYRDGPRRLGSFEWYAQGVEDAEAAHNITAAPAAQKGEKL